MKKHWRNLFLFFQQNGYDVLDSIEKCGEILARKGMPNCRTHYIHVEVLNSTYWNNHILFRDYLLKYPKFVQQYENLKRSIADRYKDERKKYTAEKNAFIQHVLNLAKSTKIGLTRYPLGTNTTKRQLLKLRNYVKRRD